MPEPTLSEVHADLAARLELDKRLRGVEMGQSSMEATVNSLMTELPRMEVRLVAAIQDAKPKSPWPAVSALAAVCALFLVIAAAIYTS